MNAKSLILSFAGLVAAVVAVVAVAAAINSDDVDTRDAVAVPEGEDGEGDGAFGICIEGAVDCVDTPLENPDEPVSNDNGSGDEPALDEEYEAAATLLALEDLSSRLGVEVEAIAVVSAEAITWGNACLGIEDHGLACAEVITPGFIITLEHSGTAYVYHTDEGKTALLAG